MLREKLRITMHKQWASNLFGEEICDEYVMKFMLLLKLMNHK